MLSSGGTGSVLAGGKFANGAVTAAFANMYNAYKSYALGRAAENAAVAKIRRVPGNKIIGRNLRYYLIDELTGKPLRANGKILRGEIDILYRDKFGGVHPVEVKDGPHAKFHKGQLAKQGWASTGHIRFYGKQAQLSRLGGKTAWGQYGTKWSSFRLWVGTRGAMRAQRQYLRFHGY